MNKTEDLGELVKKGLSETRVFKLRQKMMEGLESEKRVLGRNSGRGNGTCTSP